MAHDFISPIKNYLLNLQQHICDTFEEIDNTQQFDKDIWQHPEGGGGQSYILENGSVIERGGINFSHVYGENLPASASAHRPELAGRSFQALGISSVIHPYNPHAPTCHFNIRFFIATATDKEPIWWFGGGFDLTPYYGFDEDCQHWHQTAKKACEPFGSDIYPEFKRWADEYFYLKHRQEPRGIGGIFFDDLNRWDFETCFAFMCSVGNHFLDAYLPILKKRKDMLFTQAQRDFQCYRRGRYVEFNLVYDRGTLFGLQSNGRIESILMSLPPLVNWRYNWQPKIGTEEAKLYTHYLQPRDW